MPSSQSFILGICVMIGLALLGWFIGDSLLKFRSKNNSVIVKGIGERTANADYAIWRISFRSRGKTFEKARSKYNENLKAVKKFLSDNQIKEEETKMKAPAVTLSDMNSFQQHADAPVDYIIESNIVIESADYEKIAAASNKTYELLEQDILLSNDYGANPKFLLRDFDALRPQLLEEAVSSARKMAQKFAEHSGAKVGDIRHADQGHFSIQSFAGDFNEEAYPQKKVRVVSHVTYALV